MNFKEYVNYKEKFIMTLEQKIIYEQQKFKLIHLKGLMYKELGIQAEIQKFSNHIEIQFFEKSTTRNVDKIFRLWFDPFVNGYKKMLIQFGAKPITVLEFDKDVILKTIKEYLKNFE